MYPVVGNCYHKITIDDDADSTFTLRIARVLDGTFIIKFPSKYVIWIMIDRVAEDFTLRLVRSYMPFTYKVDTFTMEHLEYLQIQQEKRS